MDPTSLSHGQAANECLRTCLKKHKTSFYDEVDCEEDCTGDLPAINDLHCSVHPPTDNDATGECSWRFSQVQTSDPDLYKKASRCARRTTTAAEAVACADRFNLPPPPWKRVPSSPP